MVNITHVDLLALATSYPYNYQLESIANNSIDSVSFISYNNTFADHILGPNVSQELIVEEPVGAVGVA